MNVIKDISQRTDQKSGQIKAILYLLQTSLEQIRSDVDNTYELLKIGAETELAKKIERSLNDPINSVLDISSTIDQQVKDIVTRIVVDYFKQITVTTPIHLYRNISSKNDLFFAVGSGRG